MSTVKEPTPRTTPTKEEPLEKKEPKVVETTSEDEQETDDAKAPSTDDVIDMGTFEQLLDMDDEDDHEFSYSIVLNYFEQAESTFKDMDEALDKKNLSELSRLGHFLKGSSAAIGLKKVKATCEKIQNIGNGKDETGSNDLSEASGLKQISPLLPQVKAENSEAEGFLKNFYDVQDPR